MRDVVERRGGLSVAEGGEVDAEVDGGALAGRDTTPLLLEEEAADPGSVSLFTLRPSRRQVFEKCHQSFENRKGTKMGHRRYPM